ncbi:MAG: hypothetical protein RR580_04170 [Christensenellaceae bacterium]
MKDKIIEFERPASFYYEIAVKMTDNLNFLGALPMMRKAIEKDPVNLSYQLELAEILTELTKYEESNSIIFEIMEQSKDMTECYFGLGCNFIGLNEYEKAQESFEKYMEIEPDGEFREDIEDFLGFFDEAVEFENYYIEDAADAELQKKAQYGKHLLDVGDYPKAIEVLEKVNEKNPDMLYAKNNLALSYYCIKKIDIAIEKTQEILRIDKNNIHANCNMAVFLSEQNKIDEAKKYIANAIKQKSDMQDDLYKIAITLCELKEHKKALQYLLNVLHDSPYDEKILFYTAVAYYNTGELNEAIKYLSDIGKLEATDSICVYYIGYIKKVISGKEKFEEIGYSYQVPQKEIKDRIQYLNECMKLPSEVLYEKWIEEKKLRDIIIWGLEYGDVLIKRAVAEIVGTFGDKDAEKLLRRYILKRNQPDEAKNEVFIILKKMKAKEPYVAYFGGNIVEVKVGMIDLESKDFPKDYTEIVELLISTIKKKYADDVVGKAIAILNNYLEKEKKLKDFGLEKPLYAAAITCLAVDNDEENENIAENYHVNIEHVNQIMVDIAETIDAEILQ